MLYKPDLMKDPHPTELLCEKEVKLSSIVFKKARK